VAGCFKLTDSFVLFSGQFLRSATKARHLRCDTGKSPAGTAESSPGFGLERSLVPEGRLNPFPRVSDVPSGLFISHCPSQDSVLRTASWAKFRSPLTGLELQSRVLTQPLRNAFPCFGLRHLPGNNRTSAASKASRRQEFTARLKPCPSCNN